MFPTEAAALLLRTPARNRQCLLGRGGRGGREQGNRGSGGDGEGRLELARDTYIMHNNKYCNITDNFPTTNSKLNRHLIELLKLLNTDILLEHYR